MSQSALAEALTAGLAARPGVAAVPYVAPGSTTPRNLMFKVMGKVFAVLDYRPVEALRLKCDSHLAEILREHYAGVGPAPHPMLRNWIHVKLDADVSLQDIERMADHSYELVCAKLTRKQKAELATLPS